MRTLQECLGQMGQLGVQPKNPALLENASFMGLVDENCLAWLRNRGFHIEYPDALLPVPEPVKSISPLTDWILAVMLGLGVIACFVK